MKQTVTINGLDTLGNLIGSTSCIPYAPLIPWNPEGFWDIFPDDLDFSKTKTAKSNYITNYTPWYWQPQEFWEHCVDCCVNENGQYEICIELPGFKKESISIDVKENYISVYARQKFKKTEKTKTKFVFIDWSTYDVNTACATLEDGVLTITADKRKEKQEKKIHIK